MPSVRIHNGPQGNKVDGLFGLNDLNKATSRTAGRGLKTKETTNETSGEAKHDKFPAGSRSLASNSRLVLIP